MATKIYQCMQKISDAIVENKDFLTDLDREIGDADHGVNMARGFTEVMKQLPEDEEDYGVVLKKVGMVLLSKVGGASGPLYGTAYMKAGAAVIHYLRRCKGNVDRSHRWHQDAWKSSQRRKDYAGCIRTGIRCFDKRNGKW